MSDWEFGKLDSDRYLKALLLFHSIYKYSVLNVAL